MWYLSFHRIQRKMSNKHFPKCKISQDMKLVSFVIYKSFSCVNHDKWVTGANWLLTSSSLEWFPSNHKLVCRVYSQAARPTSGGSVSLWCAGRRWRWTPGRAWCSPQSHETLGTDPAERSHRAMSLTLIYEISVLQRRHWLLLNQLDITQGHLLWLECINLGRSLMGRLVACRVLTYHTLLRGNKHFQY